VRLRNHRRARLVKLRLSHPELAGELVKALNETECLAARTADDTVDVFVPWLDDGAETEHAATEILFFVRAWGAARPGFGAVLEAG
jgi:deoxyhypusine synthase